MNERPSKKQRELLNFIKNFIDEHDYGPSYREIMRALDYKSVSTVAVHVDGLIAKGLLQKSDHSARSLSVVDPSTKVVVPNEVVDHVKTRLDICSKEQLEAIVKTFKLLKLPELEVLAAKKLMRFK